MPVTTDSVTRSSGAILLVATGTGAIVAAALAALVLALVRLFGWVTLGAADISHGISVPAAAFDGVSTGTLNLGRMLVTQMFDGNDQPLPDAVAFAAELRAIVIPFYVSEAINAALVLALSVVVLLLTLRLVRGLPFVRHVTWSLAAFAVILATFSIASQFVRRIPFADITSGLFSMRKDFATFIPALQQPPAPNVIIDDSFTYTAAAIPLTLDLTLVGVAALIGLIAAAFAIGQRMQRDTEGLI